MLQQKVRLKRWQLLEYNSRPVSYFKITDDSGTDVYAYTSSSTSPDDFHADQMGGDEWMVHYMEMGGGVDAHSTVNTPLAEDIQYVDISSEGYKVHVDGFNVTTPFEWMVDYMEMGGGVDAHSTINTPLAEDIQYVDISSEGYKVHVDGFNVSYDVAEPPVATKTLEEYITSLNSDITTARQEKDARPTQNDYDTVVAERDARLTESQVRDLRLGSSMLEVVDGDASINIELEATDNLGITNPTWTPVPESKVIIHPNYLNGKIKIDVEADDESNPGVRFYRFKLDD